MILPSFDVVGSINEDKTSSLSNSVFIVGVVTQVLRIEGERLSSSFSSISDDGNLCCGCGLVDINSSLLKKNITLCTKYIYLPAFNKLFYKLVKNEVI